MSIHDDNRKALFEKNTYKNWQTPWCFFNLFNKKYKFEWDMAASKWNRLCKKYVTKKDDALNITWPENTSIWCNPPYDSRTLKYWLERGWDAARRGSDVVYLLHGRIDTIWFHEWAIRGTIGIVRGRLKFLYHGKVQSSAPFPSVVVIYRPKHVQIYNEHGIPNRPDTFIIDLRGRFKKFPRVIKRFPR